MLKKLVLSLLLVLAAVSPIVASPVPLALSALIQKKDCTVYVTRTGHRYHRAGCSSLSKSSIAMSRSEAIKKGYTPCHRCGGSNCE